MSPPLQRLARSWANRASLGRGIALLFGRLVLLVLLVLPLSQPEPGLL
jgi:hypothetical protein